MKKLAPVRTVSRGLLLAAIVLADLGPRAELAAQIVIVPALRPFFIRGDINADNRVDIADAVLLAHAATPGGPRLLCPDAADVDDNGCVGVFGAPGIAGPFCPSDLGGLLAWLQSLSTVRRATPLPPPFPGAGIDPTADRLLCRGGSGDPPGPTEDYSFQWTAPGSGVSGEVYEVFLRATTAGPIGGFSLSYLINRDVVSEFDVTLLTAGGGAGDGAGAGAVEPTLSWGSKPSHEPGFDLLLVSAIYVGSGGRVVFPPTEGAVRDFELLRLRLALRDVDPGVYTLLKPNDAEYLNIGSVGGLRTAFATPTGNPFDPSNNPQFSPGISGEIEFLRGDANADGSIDIADAFHTVWEMSNGSSQDIFFTNAADADNSGNVSANDVNYLLSFLFTEELLPLGAPYPNCGGDADDNGNGLLFIQGPCNADPVP